MTLQLVQALNSTTIQNLYEVVLVNITQMWISQPESFEGVY